MTGIRLEVRFIALGSWKNVILFSLPFLEVLHVPGLHTVPGQQPEHPAKTDRRDQSGVWALPNPIIGQTRDHH